MELPKHITYTLVQQAPAFCIRVAVTLADNYFGTSLKAVIVGVIGMSSFQGEGNRGVAIVLVGLRYLNLTWSHSLTEYFASWYFIELFPPLFKHIMGNEPDDNFSADAGKAECGLKIYLLSNAVVRLLLLLWAYKGALAMTGPLIFLGWRIFAQHF